MITDATLASILAQFALNFDPGRFGEQSAAAAHVMWSQALEDIDDNVAMLALHDLINRPDQRFPTIGEFRAACGDAERRRRQDAEQAAAEARGMLPWGRMPDDQYATEMVDVIQGALRAGLDTAKGREHDHRPGVTCPRCSALPDIMSTARTEMYRLLELRGIVEPPQGVETFACPTCHDVGFVPVGDGPEPVRPCDNCNSRGHQRWLDGHLMPDHQCGECDDLVRGRR